MKPNSSSGTVGCLSVSLNLWLVLVGAEVPRARGGLCWLHFQVGGLHYTPPCHQANFIQWILYITPMYAAFLFRQFLVSMPHGFVKDGKVNLLLYKQLYITITVAMMPVAYTGELKLQIQDDYPMVKKSVVGQKKLTHGPQNYIRGRICMLSNLTLAPDQLADQGQDQEALAHKQRSLLMTLITAQE